MGAKIKLLKTTTLPSSNQHYTVPFKQGEVVQYVGELEPKAGQSEFFRKQFVRIFRTRTKEEMVEYKKDFTPIGWKFN